jgi:hypothetical protein
VKPLLAFVGLFGAAEAAFFQIFSSLDVLLELLPAGISFRAMLPCASPSELTPKACCSPADKLIDEAAPRHLIAALVHPPFSGKQCQESSGR